MSRVKSKQTAALGQRTAPLGRHPVTAKRKNAKKKAMRRAESNVSVLSQNPLATFSDPTCIRKQWLSQRGSRRAKEFTELRNKRRWVQGQLEDKHIQGSTARELLKLYDKTFIGKPPGQRPGIEDMSGGAKLVN
ncbi:hypothetical protein HO173_008622 [Letharia columbiana]|uniref:Uncharacterized protein n=1 Tax=Letharia columbiana TaxID=112416 RepID=A0A8H6FQZ4_9LECA|nr:uncharacterized protein HO173_008622 [Letharia columbiana]KAF6233078.1 hypothetical protein HO173_008622 [Letharia columbiana]